jgi:UDP:flavonoid glycosyltransferase YjiC (YdhE family)
MRVVIAVHGTRGDVEPCAAAGLELQRRGHNVQMAVAPNMVEFVESAGLAAVAYGPDSAAQIGVATDFLRNVTRIQHPSNIGRAISDIFAQGWAEMGETLVQLTDGADLLFTGHTYQGVALNVAEYQQIPLAALHYFPVRVNSHVGLPAVPALAPLTRSAMRTAWWAYWRVTKGAEDAQRRNLGLPKVIASAEQRMADRDVVEIQAYDEACFPGLAAEWGSRRPFVGALTMQLRSDSDDEAASWIAGGTPPVYFSFGSTPVLSPAETVAMIGKACEELGVRALIYCPEGLDTIPHPDHVKLVGPLDYAAILPACRAVVHHGGAGTTAAGLRAGKPTLILWDVADQPIWATQVKRLKVGTSRRFSSANLRTLVADLRAVLSSGCESRALELATRMTDPVEAVARAADLLESSTQGGPARPNSTRPGALSSETAPSVTRG